MLDRQSVLGDLHHDLRLSLGEPVEIGDDLVENRVSEENPEEVRRRQGGPTWGEMDEDEEIESELVEYAAFEGGRETVLQNTTLQYAMFQVLRTIARQAEKGTLTAITERDGELESWRIVEGEERPASIEVVEGPADDEAANSGVNWRDNKYISD